MPGVIIAQPPSGFVTAEFPYSDQRFTDWREQMAGQGSRPMVLRTGETEWLASAFQITRRGRVAIVMDFCPLGTPERAKSLAKRAI